MDANKSSIDLFGLGERLRAARVEKGLNREEVSKATKIGKTSISVYEMGDKLPPLKNLCLLCELYGVTPNDMILNDGK